MRAGDEVPTLGVTPDATLPSRYAEVSGDLNPIHTDPEFAQAAGLPGVILHGLWSMAQVARAATGAADGDALRLRRLAVQFRGFGLPEQEVEVGGTVREAGGEKIVLELVARQAGRRIVRGAEAELAAKP